ncbi:MAG: bifunctional UDP-N-acetylmuramoyl-tripeptide:D-alanyl-D-alanine ligase/alanine racemase, partial [Saprospiraceae bacterium]|nr:bifunctional UDP-N-acetylmuramoyl-tripeptide:D-alanyl-D-alanine ligase/alanine racemase [Saprospiraceae bacterium]
RFPEYQMDLVRLGIGIYGIDSSRELQAELQPVLTLKATISQIKEVPAEETVGYGRQGQLSEPKRIAVISIGYADGLLRGAGNGRFSVLIRGQLAPIVGNVCMDMCMVDLSQTPDAAEGDEVIVFGKDQPVQLLADSLQTIPYEVFTNISGRVKRLYVQE